MLASGAVLGGEQSGHIVFLEHNTTGDGLLTALQLLRIVKERGRTLGSLRQDLVRFPQSLLNVMVATKQAWQDNRKIASALENIRQALGQQGRVLVRASGTEPVIRVLVEAAEHAVARGYAEKLAQVIASELGGSVLK
jgi:phosphoglucosamine mutase